MSYNAFEDQDELPSLKEATTKNNNIVKEKKKMTEQVKETTTTELPKKEGVITFKGLQDAIRNQQKEQDAKLNTFFNSFSQLFNEYVVNLVKTNPSAINHRHTISSIFIDKIFEEKGDMNIVEVLNFCANKINKIDANYNMMVSMARIEPAPEKIKIEIFKDKEIVKSATV